ncbi:hypothetical protein PRIPAC_81413 [Pristionchus pacificus]|uniref:Uncharacterized protein n=1 Tax=Pristionchus pacificus TaxID=54126 RepID=A0A2A6BHF5_PRIPA|nr:hypothetical protein PRIPAC_81413 [Pristionchus pacificus]|eukprot:PDM65324.1 hypothetical protein PRIPAC_52266 [Pristionchus pacificus]
MWRLPTRFHYHKPDFSSAVIPILIVTGLMLLVVAACKVYRWKAEQTQQLAQLEQIYDTLEEIDPRKPIAGEDPEFRIRVHQAVCMPYDVSPFFQPRSRYHKVPHLPTLFLTSNINTLPVSII